MTQQQDLPIIKPEIVAPSSVSSLLIAKMGGAFPAATRPASSSASQLSLRHEEVWLNASTKESGVGFTTSVKGIDFERKDAGLLSLREIPNSWRLI